MSDAWKNYLAIAAARAVCCAILGALIAFFFALRTSRNDPDWVLWVVLGAIAGALLGAGTVPRHELPWVDLSPNLRHCPRCGYDLRGDRARGCPECGWNRDKPVPPPTDKPTGPYDLEE